MFGHYGIHHPLEENCAGANQVIVADMNGDDRPDIIACAENPVWKFAGGKLTDDQLRCYKQGLSYFKSSARR